MTEINESVPDEKIVSRTINGDTESYRYIIERYEKHIFNIGLRFFRNGEDSSDFTQEVLIKVFESLESYRGISPFRYWLIKIAYNHARSRIGKMRAFRDIEGIDPESPGDLPEGLLIRSEINDALYEALGELREEYRLCVEMYFLMGLSHSEISSITGITVNTIKSNVRRAKIILRDRLKGTIAEDYNEM
jgi:RNA polymerase sigma-70 factor (ECF subfamily)